MFSKNNTYKTIPKPNKYPLKQTMAEKSCKTFQKNWKSLITVHLIKKKTGNKGETSKIKGNSSSSVES